MLSHATGRHEAAAPPRSCADEVIEYEMGFPRIWLDYAGGLRLR
jgi:hypothetical protein